jgi:hypothetical protein
MKKLKGKSQDCLNVWLFDISSFKFLVGGFVALIFVQRSLAKISE